MALITLNELEAVNNMLNLIGEMGVTDLSDTSFSYAHMARRLLIEESFAEQAVGFHWNTMTLILMPDVNGIIWAPDSTLKLRALYYPNIVHREGKLFDLDTNSFEHTVSAGFEVEVVQGLNFDSCPHLFRNMIMIQAARKLILRTKKDQLSLGYTKEEEIKARSEFFSQCSMEEGSSMFDNQSAYDHLNKFHNPSRYRRY